MLNGMNGWAKRRLRGWLGVDAIPKPAEPPKRRLGSHSGYSALASMFEPDEDIEAIARKVFQATRPVPGVLPDGRKPQFAMDDAYGVAQFIATNAMFSEGVQFMGYPYLSELTQRAEYRNPVEIIAREMTREWIDIVATGEENKDDKIRQIKAEMKRLNIQDVFRRAFEQDGFFGRTQAYIDTGADMSNRTEMLSPLAMSRAKIQRDGLKGLTLVEPIWTYPNWYDSINPLSPDFYKPKTWFVMGNELHASRLMTFASRPVPDILKPAYVFGGISLSQMLKPYVDNWLRTRQSVSDLLQAFTVFGLKTNLSQILEAGAATDIVNRVKVFNQFRSNRGLMVMDKDTEELENIAVPLGTLDKLQAQSQEHMAAVAMIPLLIYFGLSPSGLNASADDEIDSFQDRINASQESAMGANLTRTINLIQISLFGEVDPEIGYEWNPLHSLDEAELATARKTEADTGAVLIQGGVIDPQEERSRIAKQKESAYAGLDVNKEIVPPEQQNMDMQGGLKALGGSNGANSDKSDPDDAGGNDDPERGGSGGGGNPSGGSSGDPGSKSKPKPTGDALAQDEFVESQHPRGQPTNAGEFVSGGGASGGKSNPRNLVKAPIDREQWPDHVKAAKVPPAWTDVHIDNNPGADLLAVGRDAKGRRQAIYSDKFNAAQAAAKYARLRGLDEKFSAIDAENQQNRKSPDAGIKELADCMALIMRTGIRPGSDYDRGAATKAYGATTLEGQHLKALKRGGLRLRFTGKKGVALDIPVADKELGQMLMERAMHSGAHGKLFPTISDAKLSEYAHSLGGNAGFKTKDFRTLLGTRAAMREVANKPAPTNEKAYKKAVRNVAVAVSMLLGNTPTVALQSYINPVVFSDWRAQSSKGGSVDGKSNEDHLRDMFKRVAAPDGGFTYQPVTGMEPKQGYALSIYPERSVAKPFNQLKFSDLVQYAKHNKDVFSKPDHYIGAWHDPQTDQVFLDVSVVTPDPQQAEQLARQKDQIAYFDLGQGKSVTVNPNATSGGAVHAS